MKLRKIKFESLLGDDFCEELEDNLKQLNEDRLKLKKKVNGKHKNDAVNTIKSINTKNLSEKTFQVEDELLNSEIRKQIRRKET